MAAKNSTVEPDPAPFKVYLMTRAGRVMRARSEPVRAFSTKDEAVRFAGRQLGGHYAVYHKHRKILARPVMEPSSLRSRWPVGRLVRDTPASFFGHGTEVRCAD
jgi:hypothetical protein